VTQKGYQSKDEVQLAVSNTGPDYYIKDIYSGNAYTAPPDISLYRRRRYWNRQCTQNMHFVWKWVSHIENASLPSEVCFTQNENEGRPRIRNWAKQVCLLIQEAGIETAQAQF